MPGRSASRYRREPVRFAVVGQGHFAEAAILPAFAGTKRCELAAIFSDDRTKLRALRREYDVEYALPYDQFDEFLDTGAVDAVYIALPNDLHAAYTERAAQAGVHVLCEKPIAATSAQAERMIAACARGAVKLMVAYRLHFEEANLSAVESLAAGTIGEPRFFSSLFSQQVMPENSRTRRAHVAGPLRDIGITCINAARYLFREEPREVVAFAASRIGDARFGEIDEQVTALLRFSGERVAHFTCSFGAHAHSSYTVVGTEGLLRLQPAYASGSELVLEIEAGGKTKRKRFGKRDQIAPELDEFAACIREGREPEPSGREGLADLRVIEAIEAALRTGRPAEVSRVYPGRRPSMEQRREAPPYRRPPLIHVRAPAER